MISKTALILILYNLPILKINDIAIKELQAFYDYDKKLLAAVRPFQTSISTYCETGLHCLSQLA